MSDLKRFFERDSVRGVISSSELLAFKHSCTPEEYEGYVTAAKEANVAALLTV
jgi:hypothetical protein